VKALEIFGRQCLFEHFHHLVEAIEDLKVVLHGIEQERVQ